MSWGSKGVPPKAPDPRHQVFPGPPGEHRVDKPVEQPKKPATDEQPTIEEKPADANDSRGWDHEHLKE